jgi:sortase A
LTASEADRATGMATKWEAVGVGLTGIAVLLLLFFVYLFAFTPLTGVRNQHRLLQSLTGDPHAVFSLAAGHLPPPGAPVAVLEIPVLGRSEVVVNGTSAADLQQGPGLMVGTALPGEPGDGVIAGRRITYGGAFGQLADVLPGDGIKVIDGAGTFTFRTVGSKVVPLGGQVRVAHSGDSWLTLVTSDSAVHPTGELVLTARLVGHPALTGGAAEVAAPWVRLSLGGDPAAGGLAAAWAAVFLLALGAVLLAVRRWGQPWVTYLLAAPVLLACGLFVCENLARCLPATL